jgi:hypothetical protein
LRDEGQIFDISVEGCCIRPRNIFLRVGSRIMIRPQGMEGLTGIVRWISDDLAGVEFDRPIYGPVLEHIATIHPVEG